MYVYNYIQPDTKMHGGVKIGTTPKLHESILKDSEFGRVWGTAHKITPPTFQRYVLRTLCSVSHIGNSTY